jgi:hypothetical protein
MLYAIYDADTGRISQANKLFVGPDALKDYEQLLANLGHQFVGEQRSALLPPEYWFVNAGKITERPAMEARALETTVKAGGSAVVVSIPQGASIDVLGIGAGIAPTAVWSHARLDGDEFEFPAPVPMTYRVVIKLWPFQDSVIDIAAET